LLMVAAAQTLDEGSQLLASRAGSDVDNVGFVARNVDTRADELLLTRHVISWWAADATVVLIPRRERDARVLRARGLRRGQRNHLPRSDAR